MKIGHLDNKPSVAPTANERNAARKTNGEASTTRAEPSAKVDISTAAAALGGDLAAEGSFDTAKVDRIAQAIRDGKFEINAGAIADKLIANAQVLVGKPTN